MGATHYSFVLMIGMIATKKGWFIVDRNGNKTPCSNPNGNTILNLNIKPL